MSLKQNLALLALAAVLPSTHAAVSVTLTPEAGGLAAFEYEQSFDSLPSAGTGLAWANDSTFAGWSLFDSTKSAKTTYRANNGSDTAGSFYSYGNSADRALGAIGSGATYWGSPASGALSGYITLALRNDTGQALSSVGVYWDAEQWRLGQGNPGSDALDFRFGLGDTFKGVSTWVNTGVSFKYNSPVVNTTSGAGAALDGNANAVSLGGDIALDWQPGQTLWLTWIDYNSAGNDHGLAIDNVYVSTAVAAVPEPEAAALALIGLGLVAGVARRRAQRA